jgi:hypothetical protein
MAKKAAKAKLVKPEAESQGVPKEGLETDGQVDQPEAEGKLISKAEAVRRVIADGIDNPSVGSQEIKKRFDIDVTPQHFSAAKAQMKSREGAKKPKGKPGRKPKGAPSQAVEGYLSPPPKPAPAGGSELLDAMEAMKPLVASLGKEQVKRIVDLLG